jgi:L-amino acid N-acyltransferase YncA
MTDGVALFSVRKAVPNDAAAIVLLLQEVVSERVFTAINEPWSAAEQERHIATLSDREAIQVAEDHHGNLIGYQVLELWAATLASMAHVGQVGTFIRAAWRGQTVGCTLFNHTLGFALAHGYAKFIIQVRSVTRLANPSTGASDLTNADA